MLTQLRGEATSELFLEASTTIARYVLPPRLAAVAQRFSSIHLWVANENTEHIVEGVRQAASAWG